MSDEVTQDLSPLLKLYKDGRVERFLGTARASPSLHPQTGVQSKDVVISTSPLISARLYIPRSSSSQQKLPVLVYFHGGGFCIESAFSPTYQDYLNSLVSEANVVAVSVDYRLAPDHPFPAAYEDSWATLKWVESHFEGKGPDDWPNRFADLDGVFFSGDSVGANIAHHMGLRVGAEKPVGFKLKGVAFVHPYFWGEEPIEGEEGLDERTKKMMVELWRLYHPSTSGSDDPCFNPAKDPKIREMGCEKMLICVAGKGALKDRG